VYVWDVLGKRTPEDEFVLVGGVKAPDAPMALLLARETHFRHKEGIAYAVRRRGSDEMHASPYEGELLGGVTDRSYRRQEAYAGVGGRLKRLTEEFAARGLRIDRPRPPAGRARRVAEDQGLSHTGGSTPSGEVPSGADLTPEDLAARGTAG
jgi:1,2-phenylacetyl-CoA epoxidase PaaB subunit